MDLETNEIWHQLYECSNECIYALVNDTDKRAQVYHTKSFYKHLTRIIEETKLGSMEYKTIAEDTKKIRIVILETKVDGNTRLVLERYRNYYRDLGYTPYKVTTDKDYKVELQVIGVGRNTRYGVFLKGYNTNILLAKYKTYDRANGFIERHYKDGVKEIVYGKSCKPK